MPIEEQAERSPCAQLQVLESKVKDLDRRFDEHSRTQNSQLVSINVKLNGLTESLSDNRQDRTQQIGDLKADIVDRFNRIFLAAIGLAVPVMAGLLYLILNQALKTP